MSAEHEKICELLHAYLDGELDLANTRETERHLQSCADCRATEKTIRELRGAITGKGTAYRAPHICAETCVRRCDAKPGRPNKRYRRG